MMHKRMEDLEERRGHFCFSRNGWKLRGRFTFDGACKFCVRFDEQRRTFARYVSQTAYRVARPETIKLSVIFRGHAARPSTGVLIPAFSIPALLSLSLSLVAKDRWHRGDKVASRYSWARIRAEETIRNTIATVGRSKRKKVRPEEVV